MNYAKVKQVSELKKKQKELAKMSGADRTKLEEHIISQSEKESEQASFIPEGTKAEESKPTPEPKKEEPKQQAQGNKNANRR